MAWGGVDGMGIEGTMAWGGVDGMGRGEWEHLLRAEDEYGLLAGVHAHGDELVVGDFDPGQNGLA